MILLLQCESSGSPSKHRFALPFTPIRGKKSRFVLFMSRPSANKRLG